MTKKLPAEKLKGKRLVKGVARFKDRTFSWVEKLYPQHMDALRPWVEDATNWIALSGRSSRVSLLTVSKFIEDYLLSALHLQGRSIDPAEFFRTRHLPPFTELASTNQKHANRETVLIHDFLNHVLRNRLDAKEVFPGQWVTTDGVDESREALRNPITLKKKRWVKGVARGKDRTFSWVEKLYPQHMDVLRPWVEEAKNWIALSGRSSRRSLDGMSTFIEDYLLNALHLQGRSTDPAEFFRARNPPSFTELASINQKHANGATALIHNFLNHVLRNRLDAKEVSPGEWVATDGVDESREALRNPIPLLDGTGRHKTTRKDTDSTLAWVRQKYPHLEAWRELAAAWLGVQSGDRVGRLVALSKFFDQYLASPMMPKGYERPQLCLSRATVMPSFIELAGPNLKGHNKGQRAKWAPIYANHIHDFLNWVLNTDDYSETDDHGRRVVSSAFVNFVQPESTAGVHNADSSVRQALPYGLIAEARRIIVQGPNFSDWTWAQSLLGAEVGETGKTATDWYEVDPASIDEQAKTDPDFVWRERVLSSKVLRTEVWSPVRYVALLIKLILPLRTMQVRVLDSGEADTWRYLHPVEQAVQSLAATYRSDAAAPSDGGRSLGSSRSDEAQWVLNTSPLAEGTERSPLAAGVFRRATDTFRGLVHTELYINTNKTNDVGKGGSSKGYAVPWPQGSDYLTDPYYWLTKLRNWQEKYNPVKRRTPWTELKGKGIIGERDIATWSQYTPSCFLFRMPEVKKAPHLPIKDGHIVTVWGHLLEELQSRLAKLGHTHANGSVIELVKVLKRGNGRVDRSTDFPLHGLRVALITALALDGLVPFDIMQRIVGHSRLLMTLYYFKPGQVHIRRVLEDAAEHLEKKKESSIVDWLLNAEHKDLEKRLASNHMETVLSALPPHPAQRNAAGWMAMHHGTCLVGGNTSEGEVNDAIGGCYNGGPNIGSPTQPTYTVVPGGPKNCVRCRWFVTEPHHMPALMAQFNNHAYHFDLARDEVAEHNRAMTVLQNKRFDAEARGELFTEYAALKQAERLLEAAAKRYSDLAKDLCACWKLIQRCMDILNSGTSDTGMTALVVSTDLSGVQAAVEEVDGELLQLAQICEDVEAYPDLSPGKAVLRRSQLLDYALQREGMPTPFMRLTEQQQLQVGNAFMRRLAKSMNQDQPSIGRRAVVDHIESGRRLQDLPGFQEALQSLASPEQPVTMHFSQRKVSANLLPLGHTPPKEANLD